MIQRLVRFVLRMPAFVLIISLGLLALGLYCYKQLDIEAYPNPVPPMIEIITQPNGWSAEEVERYVTIPLENGLNGMIDLDHIRSQSLFGLSDVKCYFTWNAEYHLAQQRVLNRLNFVSLPPGMSPQLSPWSAIGEIYRYVVRGEGYSLTDLKTAQDWILERQFRQAPGVIDVVGYGGLTKEYHVEVDPFRLKGHGLTLSQLVTALSNANQNVGGQRLTVGEQSFDVRAIGLFHSLSDIREVAIAAQHGTPVRVRDVAEVSVGHAPRLGIVGKDLDPDVVQGTVLMRYGGDSLKTLDKVHEKVDQIAKYHILPPGMRTEAYYDRANLVELTTHTVIENLLLGMVLVALVLWLFLGHGRAALITALNIPLALMIAFIGMVGTGTPANLISLGAVDFGIVVDSTVIMMENIFRHLSTTGRRNKIERILMAASEVGPPMFSSTLVIAVAFIPLFTLTGVAGVIFSPMAHTYAFAIGGAIVLALTLTPVLAEQILKIPGSDGSGRVPGETGRLPTLSALEHEPDNWLMRTLKRFYMPLFAFSLRHKRVAVAIGAVVVLASLGAGATLGREFMPKLEEGNFWIRATLPMSISLEQSSKYVGRMRAVILGCPDAEHCDLGHRAHPEITTVVSQLGRPDDGTDVSGFYNIELFAPLRPSGEWPRGVTKQSMTAELSHELGQAFPGVIFNFSQMISDNVEEALSGVKGENTVKVVGPDLVVNEAKANEIVDVMSTVKGVEDLGLFPSLGQPNVRITPDRIQCGRYGLNVGDVEAVVQAAIGGQAVTQVYEGEKHFDLTVRWAPPYRKDLKAIRNILVATPDGAQNPSGTARPNRRRRRTGSDLPRGQPAICTREVLSARPRPRLNDRRGTGEDRREDQAPLRHAPRVGGRDQPTQRGDGTPGADHSDYPAGDRNAGLLVGKELEGHVHRAGRDPCCLHRRDPGAPHHPHTLFHLSRDGVHLDLRYLRAGRAHRSHICTAFVGRRHGARSGRPARRRTTATPCTHDHLRRDVGTDACRVVAWHWCRYAETARHRRHRGRTHPSCAAATFAARTFGPRTRR